MQVKFGYGRDCQEFTINENNLLKVLSVNPLPPGRPEMAEVAYALEHPIGTPRLREIVKPGEKVVIITSDVTRPMPTRKVLPLILAELQAGGVALADIQVVLALGSHRAHTPQEQRYLVGEELFEQLKVVDSDPQDVVRLGITPAGNPVDIFRPVAEATGGSAWAISNSIICGLQRGAKAIMPGFRPEAIQCNHRFMVDPQSRTGNWTPIRCAVT